MEGTKLHPLLPATLPFGILPKVIAKVTIYIKCPSVLSLRVKVGNKKNFIKRPHFRKRNGLVTSNVKWGIKAMTQIIKIKQTLCVERKIQL